MNSSQVNYDPIGVVVDWLDACRAADLRTLLTLYDNAATLECKCESRTYHGVAEIEEYWRPKLSAKATDGFILDEIFPADEGLDVRYFGFEGKLLHINFKFNEEGKIATTVCGPFCSGSAELAS